MSRAGKIFKGVVAAATGALGLLAKRDYDELQAQKIKRKVDLTFAADDILKGKKVDDPKVKEDAEKMIAHYGLEPRKPRPSNVVKNPQNATAPLDRTPHDGRI